MFELVFTSQILLIVEMFRCFMISHQDLKTSASMDISPDLWCHWLAVDFIFHEHV